mgnify:FL=1|tara:strand:- start:509 stop:853 length:345 start_codon:yes stop_codon:yes gene_type:complete
MTLTDPIKDKIRSHAKKVFPEECCGLILENESGDIILRECENSAEDKEDKFKISIEEYLNALLDGDVAAVYHSHTKGDKSFSSADKEISQSLELTSVLYISSKDSFEVMEPDIA